MFPTDKGESASEHVSKIIEMIRNRGVSYQLNAMGTLIETDTLAEAQEIVSSAYKILAGDCKRVYCTVSYDIRDGKSNRLHNKVRSIEEKIGPVNH